LLFLKGQSGFPDPVSLPEPSSDLDEPAPETAPELLNGNLILSLKRDREVLKWAFDRDDAKICNMIVATSTSTKQAAIKVDQNRLMAERQPEALERVLARMGQLMEKEKEEEDAREAAGLPRKTSYRDENGYWHSHPALIEAAPMPLVSIIEEPAREPDFTEFHRLKTQIVGDDTPKIVGDDTPKIERAKDAPSVDPGLAARHYRRTGVRIPPEPAKGPTAAPSPVPAPEAQREMSDVERALGFKFDR
jgi:hypothetical protein